MHFGDQKQLEENIIKLCVYKHEILGEPNKFDYDISSIYEIRHIKPHQFIELFYQFEFKFSDTLKCLKSETHYLITLKNFDYSEFKIVDIEVANHNSDPLATLH